MIGVTESKPGLSDLLVSHCVAVYWGYLLSGREGPLVASWPCASSSLPSTLGAGVRGGAAAALEL